MEPNDLLRLSDRAAQFISQYIKPIATPDYIGWILPLPKKYKAVFVVDYSVDKTWDLIPTNPQKKFKPSLIKKALKFLIHKGWLETNSEPFAEFSPELRVDLHHANIVPPKNAVDISQVVDLFPEMSILYDDDVSGITLLDDEDGSEE